MVGLKIDRSTNELETCHNKEHYNFRILFFVKRKRIGISKNLFLSNLKKQKAGFIRLFDRS